MRKKRKLRARAAAEAEAAAAALEARADSSGEPEVDASGEASADSSGEPEVDADTYAAGEGRAEAGAEPDPDAPPEDDSDSGTEALAGERLKSVIESLLFVAEAPLSVNRMRALTRAPSNKDVQAAIDALIEDYQGRGILLYKVGGGYQFRSHAQNSPWVQKLVVGKPVRLTRAQLETLAIIAYRQPITRPEIDDIRGVDCGGTLRLLLERELIRVLGKKEEPGRPLLYGTTPDFLEFFNLNDLRDLPTLTEYSELTDESLEEVERLSPQEGEGSETEEASEGEVESGAETEEASEGEVESGAGAGAETEDDAGDDGDQSDGETRVA